MTNVFAVIGENKDDPNLLLVLGDDGQHYLYHVSAGVTAPIEIDDGWSIDQCPAPTDETPGEAFD